MTERGFAMGQSEVNLPSGESTRIVTIGFWDYFSYRQKKDDAGRPMHYITIKCLCGNDHRICVAGDVGADGKCEKKPFVLANKEKLEHAAEGIILCDLYYAFTIVENGKLVGYIQFPCMPTEVPTIMRVPEMMANQKQLGGWFTFQQRKALP